MNDIYRQLKDKFIISHAGTDWKGYREVLTDLAVKEGEEFGRGSIAVLGAGRCNDIDLDRLSSSFDEVALIDVDEASMKEAVEDLSEEARKKVHITCATLSGITEVDIALFSNDVYGEVRREGINLTKVSLESIINKHLDILEGKLVKERAELSDILPERTFDVILCSGVCSQLFTMVSFFIRSVVSSVAGELIPEAYEIIPRLESRLSEFNSKVVPPLVEAVAGSAKQTFIFSNEYSETYPIEGAYQCINTVRECFGDRKEYLTTWEFNRQAGIIFDMLVQVITKK